MAGHLRPKNGGWELIVYLGKDPVTGRKRYRSKLFRGPKRQAERELARMVADVDEDRRPPTEATVKQLLEKYLEHLERMGRSAATMATYRPMVKNVLIPKIGHIGLGALSAEHLDDVYAELARLGRSGSNIRQHHAVISGALRQAEKWGWIDQSVARLASPPNRGRSKKRPPTRAEILQLLDYAESHHPTMGVLIFLAAITGARRGELCALRWIDLDLDSATPVARFTGSITDAGGVVAYKATKGGEPKVLALDESAVVALRAHRARLEGIAEELEFSIDPGAYVFSQDLAGAEPYRPGRVTNTFMRMRDKVGLDSSLKLHHMRHFMAIESLMGGHDVRTVAGRLGHADPSMTLRYYAAFMPAADQRVAKSMGEILARTPPVAADADTSDAGAAGH